MFSQCFAALAPRGRRGAQGPRLQDKTAGGNTYNLTHVDGRARNKGAIEAEDARRAGAGGCWRMLWMEWRSEERRRSADVVRVVIYSRTGDTLRQR